ncbi:hypothetical protein PC9H_011118 [Pleurotus ostreatus]|uniref:Carrier domain-containing protein n=1 Tax=Pleurotus ostreatus TaxID=5322 RepID=A0A8H7DPA9_PLEOS|nr:uncharacterized protein PC9H_011118 [Pleurotus ostreatus]KAF7422954.1 hypothetical protein PC9H_011118 [Pleurotus ostreatus]KAJ8691059.1 hypothetical protein PTI98_010666 [Pleurotus ostreatus]
MSPVIAGSTFIRPYLNLGYGNDRPDGVNSLPELIEFNSRHNPDHIFGLQSRAGEGVPPVEITFEQLQFSVESACAWMVNGVKATTGRTRREQAVPPVAILLGSDIGIYIYMAALLRIGTPVLCLSARLTPVAIAHLLKATKPTCMFINAQVTRAAKETLTILQDDPEVDTIPLFADALSYEELLDPENSAHKGLPVPPVYTEFKYEDRDAVILHSSGTTGLPKPIFHAQAYLLIYGACHRLPEQKQAFRFNVSTLPLYHGFGLLAPSLSLSIGMPFVLPPASVIPTARLTIAAIQSVGARSLLSVPSIIEDITRFPGGLDILKTLDFIAIGGAPMKEHVGSELVAQGVNLLNHWGVTEIGAIAPVERIPPGYDWHYLRPRTDMGLKFVKVEDANGLTYRLIGQAPGWPEPYVVQDYLVANPNDNKQYKILGRADDLIVLATGEKVRPANMERAISEHPDVKEVLAFGDGQLSLGLLVELAAGKAPADLSVPENHEALLASIDPYLERGNSFTDKHGKITREMIVFTRSETKPLVRTDKGSLARKTNYAAFDTEIKNAYDRADALKAVPFPLPSQGGALLNAVRELVENITGSDEYGSPEADNADFFEVGMDSLQANRLRRSILTGLRVTKGLAKPVEDIEADFCFQNSTIIKLYDAIVAVMEGTYGEEGGDKESKRLAAMAEAVEEFRSELISYQPIATEARKLRAQNTSVEAGSVVLLTGSTGSLGCMLVARLASDPTVTKLICFNRPQPNSKVNLRQRQLDAMEKRGAIIDSKYLEKVEFYEADTSRVDFGLVPEVYESLSNVTHIFHNAWPVNFNRNLSSFAPHVRALCNFVRLGLISSGKRGAGAQPTRVMFASSIAVVGKFPLLNPKGPLEIPEVPLDAINTAEFGYPEAKWVGERVLMAADEIYGTGSGDEPLVRTSNVRIGQMTGAEGTGAWNESEHFPIIVRTAQTLKALPILHGSLSWMPVNRAANAITDFLFCERFRPFYHMENPSRQSWAGLLDNLAAVLGGISTPLALIPFPEWLDRVRALGEDPERNAAFKVLNFLEHDFVRMASGPVILRTSTAREDSPTMVNSTAVDKKHLEEYVTYWKKVKALR